MVRVSAATLTTAPSQGPQDTSKAPYATIQRASKETPSVLKHLTQEHVGDISTQSGTTIEIRIRIPYPAIVLPQSQKRALGQDGAQADQLEGALVAPWPDRKLVYGQQFAHLEAHIMRKR